MEKRLCPAGYRILDDNEKMRKGDYFRLLSNLFIPVNAPPSFYPIRNDKGGASSTLSGFGHKADDCYAIRKIGGKKTKKRG